MKQNRMLVTAKRKAHLQKIRTKRKAKKIFKNVSSAILFSLFTIFGWMIVKGTIELVTNVADTTLILIGIIGLSVLGYFGLKK